MSEENPPVPGEADDASKAETIRITLPPKQETAAVKRETVRINLPGRPGAAAGSTTPKKETTKLPSGLGAAPPPPAAPSAPSLPPPVAPPSAPSAPSVPGLSKPGGAPPPPKPLMTPAPGAPALTPAPPALGKPLAGTAPKPPSLGGNRPTMPLKPAPSAAAPGIPAMPTPAPSPMVQKAASPKKETARITLPPEGTAKPALPKATIKMGQTQPLVNRPAPAAGAPLTVAKTAPAPVLAPAGEAVPAWLGIAALIVSIASFVFVLMSFQGAGAVLSN